MNMFLTLVSTLTHSEKERIRGEVHKTETEEKLLDAILNVTDKTQHHLKEQLCKQLGFTSTHFDKICSILFEKCLTLFAGNDYQKKSFFLNGKYLHDIRLHFLLSYEKKNIRTMRLDEKKSFYAFAYKINLYGNTWQGENRKVKEFAQKYYKVSSNKNDYLYIDAITLTARIDFFRRANLSDTDKSVLCGLVNALVENCNNTNDILLQFEAYSAALIYYSRIAGDSGEGKKYAGQAYGLCMQNPDLLADSQMLVVLMEIAGLYYIEGENDAAYQVFHRIFEKYYDLAKKQYRSIEQFTQTCLLLKKYDEANYLIKEYWLHYCDTFHEALTVPACIMVAKYYLLTGTYSKAFSLIEKAEQHVDKNRFFHTDAQIRNLKTLFFALSGDTDTALMLCQRNIKYLHSKAESKEKTMFTAFFRILQSIINNPYKPLTKRQNTEMEFFRKGTAGVYGELLDTVQAQYRHKKN